MSDCIIVKLKLDSVLINSDKLNECVNNLANAMLLSHAIPIKQALKLIY